VPEDDGGPGVRECRPQSRCPAAFRGERAVEDRDLGGIGRRVMESAGQRRLTRARLPVEQDRQPGGGGLFDLAMHPLPRR
jgi:hypothetical protein